MVLRELLNYWLRYTGRSGLSTDMLRRWPLAQYQRKYQIKHVHTSPVTNLHVVFIIYYSNY